MWNPGVGTSGRERGAMNRILLSYPLLSYSSSKPPFGRGNLLRNPLLLGIEGACGVRAEAGQLVARLPAVGVPGSPRQAAHKAHGRQLLQVAPGRRRRVRGGPGHDAGPAAPHA